jgi:hypothetical protein
MVDSSLNLAIGAIMQEHTTGPRAPRSTGRKVAAIVAASLVALMSAGFLTAGGLLLWADSKKDDQGYVSTDTERFATTTSALATENLDVDLDGAGALVDEDVFGKLRVRAESNDGKPVFVGIARTADVTDYLRGSAHALVTDVEYDPFDADYRVRRGDRAPGAPGAESFWAASAQGAGRQGVIWDVEDGDWSVVVMNADGSRGVDVAVSSGASIGWLDDAAKFSLTTGFVLLIVAGGLVYIGFRRRAGQPPLGSTETATVTPA